MVPRCQFSPECPGCRQQQADPTRNAPNPVEVRGVHDVSRHDSGGGDGVMVQDMEDRRRETWRTVRDARWMSKARLVITAVVVEGDRSVSVTALQRVVVAGLN